MTENPNTFIHDCCQAAMPSKPFAEGINCAFQRIRDNTCPVEDSFEKTVSSGASPETTRPLSGGSRRGRHTWLPRMAAAAAIAALCVGGTAYAVDKLGLSLWQTDNYQVQVAPTGQDSPNSNETVAAVGEEPHVIDQYRLNFDYIPDALSDRSMDIDCGSFHMPGYDGWSQFAPGIQFYTLYLDTNEAAPFTSIASGMIDDINGHEAAVLDFDYGYQHSKRSTQRRLYVLFPDIKRIVRLQTSDADLYEELEKVAEGLSFTPTGDTTEIEMQLLWSNEIAEALYVAEAISERAAGDFIDPLSALSERTYSDKQMGPLLTTSESFSWASNPAIKVTVDHCSLSSNGANLDRDKMPFGWRALLNEDGTFNDNTISFVKYGDGASTSDMLVKQKTVPLQLLSVDVTYTNASAEEQRDIWTTISLESALHENGQWSQYQRVDECPEADEAQNLLHVNTGYCAYLKVVAGDATLGGGGGDIIDVLEPRESVTVRYCWLVNADETNKFLLDVDVDEEGTYDNGTYGQRFVDIRQ